MSETYTQGGQEKAGGVIIAVVSFLAAVLVIAGLLYAAGTGERHKAALAAAGCEPNLSPSGLQCTTVQMLTSDYMRITTPASQQLKTDLAAYTANEWRHLGAAKAALRAEAAAENALDLSLARFPFPPAVAPMAKALLLANRARAILTADQAGSSSFFQLRSFDVRVKIASTAVRADLRSVGKALDARPTATQEP
jgi:hypothetical protein